MQLTRTLNLFVKFYLANLLPFRIRPIYLIFKLLMLLPLFTPRLIAKIPDLSLLWFRWRWTAAPKQCSVVLAVTHTMYLSHSISWKSETASASPTLLTTLGSEVAIWTPRSNIHFTTQKTHSNGWSSYNTLSRHKLGLHPYAPGTLTVRKSDTNLYPHQ